jgi:hypothetical protein
MLCFVLFALGSRSLITRESGCRTIEKHPEQSLDAKHPAETIGDLPPEEITEPVRRW